MGACWLSLFLLHPPDLAPAAGCRCRYLAPCLVALPLCFSSFFFAFVRCLLLFSRRPTAQPPPWPRASPTSCSRTPLTLRLLNFSPGKWQKTWGFAVGRWPDIHHGNNGIVLLRYAMECRMYKGPLSQHWQFGRKKPNAFGTMSLDASMKRSLFGCGFRISIDECWNANFLPLQLLNTTWPRKLLCRDNCR